MCPDTGRYSGLAPAITALTATFSTVSSQNSRNGSGAADTTLSGGWLVLEHGGDPFLGRQNDRQEVGPVLDEQLLEIVFGIGREQSRGRALEDGPQVFLVGGLVGASITSCMNGRRATGSLPSM
jgi:hypothetical protein